MLHFFQIHFSHANKKLHQLFAHDILTWTRLFNKWGFVKNYKFEEAATGNTETFLNTI